MGKNLIEETLTYSALLKNGRKEALQDFLDCTSGKGFINISLEDILEFENEVTGAGNNVLVKTLVGENESEVWQNTNVLLSDSCNHNSILIISGPSLDLLYGKIIEKTNIKDHPSDILMAGTNRIEKDVYMITCIWGGKEKSF